MGHKDPVHRRSPASWLLALAAVLLPLAAPAAASDTAADPVPLQAQVLDEAAGNPTPEVVAGGSLDARFQPFAARGSHYLTRPLWLRLPPLAGAKDDGRVPVLMARSGLDQAVELFAHRGGRIVPVGQSRAVPKFGGAEDKLFALPSGLDPGQPLYARVTRVGRSATDLQFSSSDLASVLSE